MRGMRFASVLALSLLAAATAPVMAEAPRVAPKTPPPACTANKDIVFQIDQRSTYPQVSPMKSKFVLHSNGAWSFEEWVGSKIRFGTGCIASAQVDALAKVFTAASWKVTSVDWTCTIDVGIELQYRFRGKLVASWESCDGRRYEPSARAALAKLGALANPLIATTTPPSTAK
jgi:hypothetical protein